MITERFAPSPTGLLHLGHAFSALKAFEGAKNGRFLLRIEDIDQPRCRPEFEAAIFEDLDWLGLSWEEPVLRQSDRMAAYKMALSQLTEMGLTYPCSCNRSDIKSALSAEQEGALIGPDGLIYPRLCVDGVQNLERPLAVRLNMTAVLDHLPDVISYQEIGLNTAQTTTNKVELPTSLGDIVLARKDIGTSYHLSVVVDDAFQEVTHITRGEDMASATLIHRVLQILLELPAPIYRHHRLIRDGNGKRLAKRDDARAIRNYRDAGLKRADLLGLIGQ